MTGHLRFFSRYQELLERKTQLERGEEAIQAERERMGRSAQEQMGREKELERLRADNDRSVRQTQPGIDRVCHCHITAGEEWPDHIVNPIICFIFFNIHFLHHRI